MNEPAAGVALENDVWVLPVVVLDVLILACIVVPADLSVPWKYDAFTDGDAEPTTTVRISAIVIATLDQNSAKLSPATGAGIVIALGDVGPVVPVVPWLPVYPADPV